MEQCQDLASFTEQKGSMSSAASCAKPPAFCLLVGFQNIPCSSAAPSLLVPSKKLIYFLARAVRPAGTNTFSLLPNVSLQTRQRRDTGIWSGKESTGWVSAIVHGWRRRVWGIDIYIYIPMQAEHCGQWRHLSNRHWFHWDQASSVCFPGWPGTRSVPFKAAA